MYKYNIVIDEEQRLLILNALYRHHPESGDGRYKGLTEHADLVSSLEYLPELDQNDNDVSVLYDCTE